MGFLKKVGEFIFGKDPEIFDQNGRVRHNFPDEKWKKWNDRFKANPNYDWQQHSGRANAQRKSNSLNSKH